MENINIALPQIALPQQNIVALYEHDLKTLQNENKELKNRIIELKKDVTFLRTLLFKQMKTEEYLRSRNNDINTIFQKKTIIFDNDEIETITVKRIGKDED
jgi:predicted RNase H-like nuclease (RuvC/YqgF family)